MNTDISDAMSYRSSDIHEAQGAEKHRLNVAQYLGADDAVGIENQLFEIIDNSIDECIEYRTRVLSAIDNGSETQIKLPPIPITVTINENNEVTVTDKGRGIPVAPHSLTGEPTVFRIYESDSAGGKGNLAQGGYQSTTAGMHGAGAAVSKSCTEFFNIITKTIGEQDPDDPTRIIGRGKYFVRYTEGERDKSIGDNGLQQLDTIGIHTIPEYAQLGLMDTGTEITYKYDTKVLHETRNGQPCEPYDKDKILERLRYALLGINDRDSITILFQYKSDDPILVTPYDITPESFLRVTDPNNLLKGHIESAFDKSSDNWFSADVYIYRDDTNFLYSSKTVVNRLSLDTSRSNEIVRECLTQYFKEAIGYMPRAINNIQPDNRTIKNLEGLARTLASEATDRFRALIVMNLAKAKFDGQTKHNLVSTGYIREFQSMMISFISSNHNFIGRYVQAALRQLAEREQQEINAQLERQKLAEEQQKIKEIDNVIKTAELADADLLERLKSRAELYGEKDSETMLTIKEGIFSEKESWLVFVEGASAAGALGQVDNLPITVIGLQGKIANLSKDNTKITRPQTVKLLTWLHMPFKAVAILTDADSDGMHIRTLLLAFILRFAPQYFQTGSLFIINSPNARLENISDEDLTLTVYNQQITYPSHKMILTKTPAETEKLLATYPTKVRLYEKYAGLADSTTDGSTNLNILDLLKDPSYRSRVKMPTQDEADMLYDILAEQSQLKKSFANEICTDRMNYIKNKSSLNSRVKMPPLNPFYQTYTVDPSMQNYRRYEYDEIMYQDILENF